MTDNVNVTQNVNTINITQQPNNVIVSNVGAQGIPGAQGATGSTGPQGPQGSTGPQGPVGGNYTFEQQTNATTWNITHNLGYRPAVTVQDYGKITLEGDLSHTDANSLVLTFSQAVSGYAYLS